MSTKKNVLMIAGLLILGLLVPSSANAKGQESSPILDIVTGEKIHGAESKLERFADRVELTVKTTAVANNAYTLWVFLFNNPELCGTSPCTEFDLGVPGVGGSVFWGTGRVTDPKGKLNFETPIFVGPPPGQSFGGPGLTNAEGAEFIFVLRHHGEQIPSLLGVQVTSFNGACPPNSCADAQITFHQFGDDDEDSDSDSDSD